MRIICLIRGHDWRDIFALTGIGPNYKPSFRQCRRCGKVSIGPSRSPIPRTPPEGKGE